MVVEDETLIGAAEILTGADVISMDQDVDVVGTRPHHRAGGIHPQGATCLTAMFHAVEVVPAMMADVVRRLHTVDQGLHAATATSAALPQQAHVASHQLHVAEIVHETVHSRQLDAAIDRQLIDDEPVPQAATGLHHADDIALQTCPSPQYLDVPARTTDPSLLHDAVFAHPVAPSHMRQDVVAASETQRSRHLDAVLTHPITQCLLSQVVVVAASHWFVVTVHHLAPYPLNKDVVADPAPSPYHQHDDDLDLNLVRHLTRNLSVCARRIAQSTSQGHQA